MKKRVLVFLLFFVSCSNKDVQFCDCLSSGKELNEYNQLFFERTPSPKERAKLKKLKTKKEADCKNYQTMNGNLMRKKKEACEK